MAKSSLDGLLNDLKKMEFSSSQILDLFQAVNLESSVVLKGRQLTLGAGHNDQDFLLKVSTRDGEVTNWKAGTALTTATADKILALAGELRLPPVHGFVMSRIMFSQQELAGNWRYKDRLQILPCLSELRVGTGLDWYTESMRVGMIPGYGDSKGPPYPFLLEVSVPEISNNWLQMQVGHKLLDQMENLFCLFLKGVSGTLLWPNQRQWMALRSSSHAGIDYHLLQSGIGTERGGQYNSFTRWDGPSVDTFATDDYVDSLLTYQADKLSLPINIPILFDKYHSLSKERQARFDRASYFFELGSKLKQNYEMAIMNYSIAIECLLEDEPDVFCAECGKSKGSGPTRRFKEFLQKYAPVSESLRPYRDRLYKLRSAIAHGSSSMKTDIAVFSLARDRDTPMLMEWLARKSILGWLNALPKMGMT